MKSDFKSRPVYLSKDDRIKAHFTTCFLALTIFRYLEKILGDKFTADKIIDTLRNYNLKNENNLGYSPLYTRNDLIDLLHEKFKLNTAYEMTKKQKMKKFLPKRKNSLTYALF